MTVRREEEVIEMTISDAEKVGDDAVAGCWLVVAEGERVSERSS